MHFITPLFLGLVFGIGIIISGMANPAKVQNFFDIAGTWDPSFALVMGGALITTIIGYFMVLKWNDEPAYDTQFHLPTNKTIDTRLISGAAVFGVGWGISGFCPGGALPALGLGYNETYIFVAAMVIGIVVARTLDRMRVSTAVA